MQVIGAPGKGIANVLHHEQVGRAGEHELSPVAAALLIDCDLDGQDERVDRAVPHR